MALATREVELVLIARDRASPVLARLGGSFAGVSRNLGRATGVMSRHLTMMTNEYIQFTQKSALAYTQVEGVANATQKAIEESTKRIARTIPRELAQIQDAYYDLYSTIDVKSMEQGEQAIIAFAKAATTGQAPMESITRSTIGWLNALDQAPTIANINRLLNVQFELVRKGAGTYEEITREVGKAIPAIIKADQSVETFAGSFAFLTRNALNSAMAATSVARATELLYSRKAVEGLRKYGIAVSEASGKTREMVDIIQDMLPYFRGKSIAERVTVFHDMFGQGRIQARRFFDTVIPNFEEWARLVEEMKESVSEGVFEKNFLFMMEQPLSKWQLLVNRYQVVRLEIGENIWKDVNKYLIPAIDKVLTWWEKLTPASKKAVVQITVFGTALLGLTSVVFGVLSAITLLVALVTSFPLQFGAAGIALGVFSGALGKMLPSFQANWDRIRDTVENAITRTVRAVQDGTGNIGEIWKGTFKKLGNMLGVWTPQIQAKWNQAFEDWISPLRWAWDSTIGAIHEMVTDSNGKILQSYKDLFAEITTGLIGVAGLIFGRDPLTKVFSLGIIISQLDDMAPAIQKWYKTKGKEDIKKVIGNIGGGIRDMLENELAFDFGVGAIPDLWSEGFLKYWKNEWRQNISPDIARAVDSFKVWWDGKGREFTNEQFDKIWEGAIETINTVIKTMLNILKTIAYVFARFSGVSEDQLQKLRDFENTDWNLLITSITDPITSLLGVVRAVLNTVSGAISFNDNSVNVGMKELNTQLLDLGPKIVRGFFGVIEATLAGIGLIASTGLNLEPAIQKTAEQIILSVHGVLDKIPILNWFIRNPNPPPHDTSGTKGPAFGTLAKLPFIAGLAGVAGLAGYGWLRGSGASSGFKGIGRGAKGLFTGGFKGGLVGAGLGGLAHILLGLPLGAMGGFGGAGALFGGLAGAGRGFKSAMGGGPIRGAKYAAGRKWKDSILTRFGVETPRMTKDRVKGERAAAKAAKAGETIFKGADNIPSSVWERVPTHPNVRYNKTMADLRARRRLDDAEINIASDKFDETYKIYKGKQAEIRRLESMVDVTVADEVAKAKDAMSRANTAILSAETKKKVLQATDLNLRAAELDTKIKVAQNAIKNLEDVIVDEVWLKTLNKSREKLKTVRAKLADIYSQGDLDVALEKHGPDSLAVQEAALRKEISQATKDILEITEARRIRGVTPEVQLQLDSARVKLNSLEVAQVKIQAALDNYQSELKRYRDIISRQGFSQAKQEKLIAQIRRTKKDELLGTIAGKRKTVLGTKKTLDDERQALKELREGRDERYRIGKEQAEAQKKIDRDAYMARLSNITRDKQAIIDRFGLVPGPVNEEALRVLDELPKYLKLDAAATKTMTEIISNKVPKSLVADVRHLFAQLGLGDGSKIKKADLLKAIRPHLADAISNILFKFEADLGAAMGKTVEDVIREQEPFMTSKPGEWWGNKKVNVESGTGPFEGLLFNEYGRDITPLPYLARERFLDIVRGESATNLYDYSFKDYKWHFGGRNRASLATELFRGSKPDDVYRTFFSDSETIARRYDKGRMSSYRMNWEGIRAEEAPSWAVSKGNAGALEEYFKDSGIDVLVNTRHKEYLFLNDKARSRLVEIWSTATGRGFEMPTVSEIMDKEPFMTSRPKGVAYYPDFEESLKIFSENPADIRLLKLIKAYTMESPEGTVTDFTRRLNEKTMRVYTEGFVQRYWDEVVDLEEYLLAQLGEPLRTRLDNILYRGARPEDEWVSYLTNKKFYAKIYGQKKYGKVLKKYAIDWIGLRVERANEAVMAAGPEILRMVYGPEGVDVLVQAAVDGLDEDIHRNYMLISNRAIDAVKEIPKEPFMMGRQDPLPGMKRFKPRMMTYDDLLKSDVITIVDLVHGSYYDEVAELYKTSYPSRTVEEFIESYMRDIQDDVGWRYDIGMLEKELDARDIQLMEDLKEAFEGARPLQPMGYLDETLYRGSGVLDLHKTYYSASRDYALKDYANPMLTTGRMNWQGLDVMQVPNNMLAMTGDRVLEAWDEAVDVIVSVNARGIHNYVQLTDDARNRFEERKQEFFKRVGLRKEKIPENTADYLRIMDDLEREIEFIQKYGYEDEPFTMGKGIAKPQVISFEQFMNLKEIQKSQLPSLYMPELIRIFQQQYPYRSMKEFIEEYFKRTGVHPSSRFEQIKDIWTNPNWDADMRRNINTVPMERLDNILYRGSHLQDDFSSYFSASKKYVEEGPYAKPLLSTYRVTDWSGLDVKQIPNFLHGNIGGRERINFAGRADVIVTRTKDGINNYAFISKKALKRLERFNVEFYKWGERLADDSDEVAEYTEILRKQRIMAEKIPFLDEDIARLLTDSPDLYRSMSNEYSAVTRGFFPDRLYGSGSTFSAYVDHDKYPLRMEGWDKLNVRAGQGYLDMFSEDELKSRLKGSGVDVLMDTKSQRFVFLTDKAESNLETIMNPRGSIREPFSMSRSSMVWKLEGGDLGGYELGGDVSLLSEAEMKRLPELIYRSSYIPDDELSYFSSSRKVAASFIDPWEAYNFKNLGYNRKLTDYKMFWEDLTVMFVDEVEDIEMAWMGVEKLLEGGVDVIYNEGMGELMLISDDAKKSLLSIRKHKVKSQEDMDNVLRSEGLKTRAERMAGITTEPFSMGGRNIGIETLRDRFMDWDEEFFDRTDIPYMKYDEVVGFIEEFLDQGIPLYSGDQAIVDMIRAYKIQFGESEEHMFEFLEKTEHLRERIKENAKGDTWNFAPGTHDVRIEKLWDEVETFNDKVLRNIVFRGAEAGDQVYSFFSENIETALRFVERHANPTLIATKLFWDEIADLKVLEVSSSPFHMPRSELVDRFDADILLHRYDMDEWAYVLLTQEAQEATMMLNLTMQEVERYVFDTLRGGINSWEGLLTESSKHWDVGEAATVFVNQVDEYVTKLYNLFNSGEVMDLINYDNEELVNAIERVWTLRTNTLDDFIKGLGQTLINFKDEYIYFSDFIDDTSLMPASSYFEEPYITLPDTKEMRELIPDIQRLLSDDVSDALIKAISDLQLHKEFVGPSLNYMDMLDSMLAGLDKPAFNIADIHRATKAADTPFAVGVSLSNYLRDKGHAFLEQAPEVIGEALRNVIRESLLMITDEVSDRMVNQYLYRAVDSFSTNFGYLARQGSARQGWIDFYYPNVLEELVRNPHTVNAYDMFRRTLMHEWIHHLSINELVKGTDMRDIAPNQFIKDIGKLYETKDFKRFIKGAAWSGMDLHDATTDFRYPGESQGFFSDIWGRGEQAYDQRFNKRFFEGTQMVTEFSAFSGIAKYMDDLLYTAVLFSKEQVPLFEDIYNSVEEALKKKGVEEARMKIILRELEHARNKLMRKPFGMYDSFFEEIWGLTGGKVGIRDETIPFGRTNQYVGLDHIAQLVSGSYMDGSKAVDAHTYMQQLIIEGMGSRKFDTDTKKWFMESVERYLVDEIFADANIDWQLAVEDQLNELNRYATGNTTLAHYSRNTRLPDSLVVPNSVMLQQVSDLGIQDNWDRFVGRYSKRNMASYLEDLGPELTWKEAIKSVRAGKRLDVDELNKAAYTLVRYIRGEVLTSDDLTPLLRLLTVRVGSGAGELEEAFIARSLNRVLGDSYRLTEDVADMFLTGLGPDAKPGKLHAEIFQNWLIGAHLRENFGGLGPAAQMFGSELMHTARGARPVAETGTFLGRTGRSAYSVAEDIVKGFGIDTTQTKPFVQWADNLVRQSSIEAIRKTFRRDNIDEIIDDAVRMSDEAAKSREPFTQGRPPIDEKKRKLFESLEGLTEAERFNRYAEHLFGKGSVYSEGFGMPAHIIGIFEGLEGQYQEWIKGPAKAYEGPKGRRRGTFTGGPEGKEWWRIETDQETVRRAKEEADYARRQKRAKDPFKWLQDEVMAPGAKFDQRVADFLKIHTDTSLLDRVLSEEALKRLEEIGYDVPEHLRPGRLEKILKGIFSRPTFQEYFDADQLRRALASGDASWDDMPGIKGTDKFKKLKFYTTKAAWMPKWAASTGKRFASKLLGPLGWGIDVAQEIPGLYREMNQITKIKQYWGVGAGEEWALRTRAMLNSVISVATLGFAKPEEMTVAKYKQNLFMEEAEALLESQNAFSGIYDKHQKPYIESLKDGGFARLTRGTSPDYEKAKEDMTREEAERIARARELGRARDTLVWQRRAEAFQLSLQNPLIKETSSVARHQAALLDLYTENPELFGMIHKDLVNIEDRIQALVLQQSWTPYRDWKYYSDQGVAFRQAEEMAMTNNRVRAALDTSLAMLRAQAQGIRDEFITPLDDNQKNYVKSLGGFAQAVSADFVQISKYLPRGDWPGQAAKDVAYKHAGIRAWDDFVQAITDERAEGWAIYLQDAMRRNTRLREGFGPSPAANMLIDAEGQLGPVPNPYYDVSRAWRNYTGDRAYQFDPSNIEQITGLFDEGKVTLTGLHMKGMIGSIKESVAHWIKDGISDDEMNAMNLLYERGFIQQTGIIDAQIKKQVQIQARGWARTRALVKENMGDIVTMLESGMLTEADLLETRLGPKMQEVFQRAFTIDNENLWYNLIQFRDLIETGQWLPDEITTGKLMDLIDDWLRDGLQVEEIWQLGYLIGNDLVDGVNEGILKGFADTLEGLSPEVVMTKIIHGLYGSGAITGEQWERLLGIYGPKPKEEDFIRAGHGNLISAEEQNLLDWAINVDISPEAKAAIGTIVTFLESGEGDTVAGIFTAIGGAFSVEQVTAMEDAVKEAQKLKDEGTAQEFADLFKQLEIPNKEAIIESMSTFAATYTSYLLDIESDANNARFAVKHFQNTLNMDTAESPIPNVVIGKSLQRLVNIYGGNMGDLVRILNRH